MIDNLDKMQSHTQVYVSAQDKAGTEHLFSVFQFQVPLKQPTPPLRLWMQQHFHLLYTY